METPLSLSTAYATWVQGEHNNQWLVKDQGGTEIGRFPSNWTEKDCMIAIRLGRKYELEAFNRGIDFGKKTREGALLPIIEQRDNQIKILEQLNIKLSEKVEKFLIEGSEEEK